MATKKANSGLGRRDILKNAGSIAATAALMSLSDISFCQDALPDSRPKLVAS